MFSKHGKILRDSPEVCTGSVLIVLGVAAWAAGIHALFAAALAPFGIGLILSELVPLTARMARERVIVWARRDE